MVRSESDPASIARKYPGALQIHPTRGLPKEEREKEEEMARIVQSESADVLYNRIPMTYDGLVINIDLYRELLREYELDPQGVASTQQRLNRTRFTAATYGPAKAASYARFKQEAAKARRVILMGGGPASGKSTILRRIIGSIDPANTTIYDTSLTDPGTAEKEIRTALAYNCSVEIYWVFRPFHLAVEGMIQRAIAEGRYLTLERMVTLHQGSRTTILHLARQFSGAQNINISAIHGIGKMDSDIPIAALPNIINNREEDISYETAQGRFRKYEERVGIPDDLKTRICQRVPH